MVVTQQALTGFCYPDFGSIGGRCTYSTMHMNRFQRIIFICPKIIQYEPILKICGTVKSTFLCKPKNQMGR